MCVCVCVCVRGDLCVWTGRRWLSVAVRVCVIIPSPIDRCVSLHAPGAAARCQSRLLSMLEIAEPIAHGQNGGGGAEFALVVCVCVCVCVCFK